MSLAEALGITETTTPYKLDGVFTHCYVSTLAGLKVRDKDEYIYTPEVFEGMFVPDHTLCEVMDDKVSLVRAEMCMRYQYANMLKERMAKEGKSFFKHYNDCHIDLVVMWTYLIPINKLADHGL